MRWLVVTRMNPSDVAQGIPTGRGWANVSSHHVCAIWCFGESKSYAYTRILTSGISTLIFAEEFLACEFVENLAEFVSVDSWLESKGMRLNDKSCRLLPLPGPRQACSQCVVHNALQRKVFLSYLLTDLPRHIRLKSEGCPHRNIITDT